MKNITKSKVIKAGLGYTIGNILIKGINFLAVPLFSRILTTEEFGVYNTFIAYDAIIYIVIGFALHTTIKSANLEFEREIDDYTSSISLIYIIFLFAFLVIIALFGNILSSWLDFPKSVLVMLVLYSFSNAIILLYNQRISLNYDYKKYLIIALVNSLGNVFISLFFILTFFRTKKDIGRILGATIIICLIAIMLLKTMYKNAKPRYSKKYWKFGLKYSLPIVPHGISQVLLAQFDRIMIRMLVSNTAAGIYSLAGNIKLILIVITDSIATAWQTWFFEQITKGNRELIQQKAIQLIALFTILAIGLMALSPELVNLLGGHTYESGKYVAVPMILDAFILFLYNICVTAEYYTKKTTYIMIGTTIAALINIVTNYIFINQYGFIAAAYTTLFSYVCYLILHIIISKHLIKFYVIPLKWIVVYCTLVILFAVIDLIFVNTLIIRWGLCGITVIIMGGILLKKAVITRK